MERVNQTHNFNINNNINNVHTGAAGPSEEHGENVGNGGSGGNKYVLEPGEKVFAVVLLVLGMAAFLLALELWFRMSEPRIASAAAMPLFVSGLWCVMALLTVIENFKSASRISSMTDRQKKLLAGLGYAIPREVAVIILAIMAYCILLLTGVSFYITTTLFLYGSMCYLTRKDYLKNILWTAIVMAFIIIVFRLLFSVVFP